MIHIELSRGLSKPLAKHLKPAQASQPFLSWRADIAMIGSDTCIVAQEQYTRYIMVMCGLTNDDFSNFPDLFTDRIHRETAAICKQAGVYDSHTLSTELKGLLEQHHYSMDADPWDHGRILTVMEKLERRFLEERQPLPTDIRSAFKFGFQLNSRKPKSRQQPGKPSPIEAMGNRCLNLIEQRLQAAPAMPQEPIETNTVDNIVYVDFAGQRR